MNTNTLKTISLVLIMNLVGCGDTVVEETDTVGAPSSNIVMAPKADRAAVDPEEVLSEGSGEHGVEEPTQQDQILYRSLHAAAWAAKLRFPQGAQNFLHFLANTGETLEMEVDRLINDNPYENIDETTTSLESRINEQLELIKAEATDWIRENGAGEQSIEASISSEWAQFYATQGDWYWALGGFQFRLDAEISYTPGSPVVIAYTVEIQDSYNWDAGKEIDLSFDITITDEIFQRLHIVGIAQEFSIQGISSEYSYEFDYTTEL